MNKQIKELIIKNEYNLMEEFPKYKQSINQFICKLKNVNYDRMLYDLIIKSFNSKDKNLQEKEYNSRNFKKC